MKKYIHIMSAVAAFICIAACTEQLGTNPGNDPAPRATIYQYAPGEGYNTDEDVVVRFVANDKTESVYFLVEPLADKNDFVSKQGLDEYAKKVLTEGKAVPKDSLTAYNDTLTGMAGTYAITAAAVTGSETVLSESVFYGLSWTTISKGTYTFTILGSRGISPAATELQVCDTDENLFRFKDVFKPGFSLKIVALPDYTATDDYGTYTFCRVPVQATGLSMGEYGAISVRDVGYWQGDESYITEEGFESCYYTEGTDAGCMYVMAQYYVAAGNLGYGYDTYVPDAE